MDDRCKPVSAKIRLIVYRPATPAKLIYVLAQEMRQVSMESVELGKIYKHYKGGRYLILHLVEESTNARKGNTGVIYVSFTYGTIKHRDLKEFIEEVEWPDGVRRSRFIIESLAE